MSNSAQDTIAAYLNASETLAAPGAFGRELAETGFSRAGGYGSGSYSITEIAEWDALAAAEREIYAAFGVDSCECCGPILTAEGREAMDRARAELLPRWYLRRRPGRIGL